MENIENIERRQKILNTHFYYRKNNFFQIFTDKKLTEFDLKNCSTEKPKLKM